MRKLLVILAVCGLAAALVIGLGQAGSGEPAAEEPAFDLDRARERLAGAPPELAALHAQSADLLDGGLPALRGRLRELRGTPVVINKWASWCGPCRVEFPVFQQVATDVGKRVAFLGLNGKDNRGEAAEFLREAPLPFPSYVDPDEKVARDLGIPLNYPITLFLDERGKTAFIHQGQYRTAAELRGDISKYLGV